MTLFLIGCAIGLAAAIIGAIIEYWLHLRPGLPTPAHGAPPQPSFVLFVLGGLMLTGIVAILASLLLTGGIRSALIMGVGVFVSFNLGFFLIALIWIILDRNRLQSPEEPPYSANTTHKLERQE